MFEPSPIVMVSVSPRAVAPNQTLALAPIAGAQERRLELQDLIGEAQRSNPEILAAQKRYEAAKQRPRQESSLPDPTLALGYSSNGNPLPGAGLGTQPTSNIGFSFTKHIFETLMTMIPATLQSASMRCGRRATRSSTPDCARVVPGA